MTPAQIDRVRRSFGQVVLNLDQVSDAFCEHLTRLDSGRSVVFGGDPMLQRIKVGAALAGLVASIGQLDRIRAPLADLGRERAGQGVDVDHYVMVGEALVAALQEVLGEEFDGTTHRAWLLAYGQVVRAMTGDAQDDWVEARAA